MVTRYLNNGSVSLQRLHLSLLSLILRSLMGLSLVSLMLGCGKKLSEEKIINNKRFAPSKDRPEVPSYPFPISQGKFSGLPLAKDGKAWGIPNTDLGNAINKYSTVEGIWVSECLPTSERPNAYLRQYFALRGEEYFHDRYYFESANCDSLGLQSTVELTFYLTEPPVLLNNLFSIRPTLLKAERFVFKQTEVDASNLEILCGISTWTLSQPEDTLPGRSILGKTCFNKTFHIGMISPVQIEPQSQSQISIGGVPSTKYIPPSFAITGGQTISMASSVLAKSTVAIYMNGTGLCTGTLIGERYVVTAAHCIDQPEGFVGPTDIKIGFLKNSSTSFAKVLRVESHPQFGTNKYSSSSLIPDAPHFDIAIITLQDPAPEGTQPIAILPASEPLLPGEVIQLAGFGIDESEVSGKLRATETVLDKSYNNLNIFVTWSKSAQNTCSGDSGGPAFVERKGWIYVAGATSYGDPSFTCQRGDTVFMDIRSMIDWMTINSD